MYVHTTLSTHVCHYAKVLSTGYIFGKHRSYINNTSIWQNGRKVVLAFIFKLGQKQAQLRSAMETVKIFSKCVGSTINAGSGFHCSSVLRLLLVFFHFTTLERTLESQKTILIHQMVRFIVVYVEFYFILAIIWCTYIIFAFENQNFVAFQSHFVNYTTLIRHYVLYHIMCDIITPQQSYFLGITQAQRETKRKWENGKKLWDKNGREIL